MGNEIEKFDPSTLMQGVKDRIKATFVSLIPDNKWDEMVQKEIDSFFNEKQTITMSETKKQNFSGGWHSDAYVTKTIEQTPFRSLVYEMCYQKTIELIKKKMEEEWFGNAWPITEETMKENMKTLVVEAAPLAMLDFFQRISMSTVDQLRNQMQQYGR